jgi:hypothetical protein
MPRVRAAAVSLVVLLLAAPCVGASPQLGAVLPRGGQRGTDVTVRLQGTRLADAREVVFHGTGISVKRLAAVNNKRVDVVLTLAPDCPIGAHGLRLRTASGISNLKTFHVGTLPEHDEAEPNGSTAQAQDIELDSTINGIAEREDLDVYAFDGSAGERVTAEIEGFRLGDTAFDPHVAIVDGAGFELATSDDTALAWRDPVATVVLPADGRYYVAVRESAYRGSGRCWYRLHVGRFPRPRAAFPPGGAAGEAVEVTLLGDVAGSMERTVTLPEPSAALAGASGWIQPGVAAVEIADDSGTAPSPIWMRLGDTPETVEIEPNNGRKAAMRVAFPAAINGVIETPGDVDRFLVELQKDQPIVVDVFARRLRSPLDSVVDVRRPDNSSRVGGDDSGGPDTRIEFTAKSTGDVLVTLRDHLFGGSPDHVYRIEIAPPRQGIGLAAPRQQTALAVPRGGRACLLLTADRRGFGGPLTITADGLPAGATLEVDQVDRRTSAVPIVISAPEDADLAAGLVKIEAAHADTSIDIRGRYRQDVEQVLGQNNVVLWAHSVDRLPIAITEQAPFSISVQPHAAPLVRNGSSALRVSVARAEGFTGQVRLRVPFRPPGVGAGNVVNVGPNATEAVIPINANGNAALGSWKLVVTADAGVAGGGRVAVSSELIPIEIVQPFVAFAPQGTSVEQGAETTMHIAVTPREPLPSGARVELRGLPHNVKAEPVELAGDAANLAFTITTQPDSPAGRHRNLFCIARFDVNGGQVVHRLPAGELRIDTPLPPSVAAPPAPAPPPEPAQAAPSAPAEKPLTRLEKLRKEHAERVRARAEARAKHDENQHDENQDGENQDGKQKKGDG